MKQPTKKLSKTKTIVFVSILITLIVIGFFGYKEIRKFIAKRDSLVALLNKNTEIYNNSTEPSKELLLNLKNLLDFSNPDEKKLAENLTGLELEIPKISIIATSIETSAQALEKGSNTDEQGVYTLFNESLATKKATLDVLDGFVKYEFCLVKNSSKQYKNITDFTELLTTFSNSDEKVTTVDKANLVANANKKITENIELMNTIPDCFKDQYTKYLTEDMKKSLAVDIDLYNKYSEATRNLNEGLLKANTGLLQSGTTLLVDLKDKNPSFFTSENFKKAIQEPKKFLQDQAIILENQEKKIKNQTLSLKSKFFLE
jgi:hypothetical protein